MRSGRFPRDVAAAIALFAGVGGLFACGNGDDNASRVAGPDSGVTTGATRAGPFDASPCVEGEGDGRDTTITPYTACSPYTGGCIPFDPIRVPPHPTL